MFPHALNTFIFWGKIIFADAIEAGLIPVNVGVEVGGGRYRGFAAGVQIKIKPVVASFWMDRYQKDAECLQLFLFLIFRWRNHQSD